MVPVMEFDVPPTSSLLGLGLKRGQPLAADGQLPHIEARARRLERPGADYNRVCGFASDSPLPLTFPDLLARGLHLAVLTHPAFPLRLLGIIHTEQRAPSTPASRCPAAPGWRARGRPGAAAFSI